MIKMDPEDRDEAIKLYFDMGMLYKDIVQILTLEHGIIVSLRHLKRILKELGLFRRKNYSNIADVVEFVHNQLRNSGRLHGYRWMSEKCHLHNLRCKKEDVRLILSILDPEGNRQRRKRRLLRRSYYARGPNYIWHIDSYDKLKRCGICINGCVDGFSRRIVWMNSYHTSSDPQVVGGYYMEAVESLAGCPKIVRSDLGTENGHVKNIQTFLRMDDNFQEADLSYLEGPSTANQRIEYMWSFLRRECTDYWICLFQNMVDDGLFNGDFLDVNLMQFCFMHLIQVGVIFIIYDCFSFCVIHWHYLNVILLDCLYDYL